MGIEHDVWRRCELDQTFFTYCESHNREWLCLKSLTCARALIINPSTSNEIRDCVLETLVNCLQHNQEPLLVHHVLKLLSDLALHHCHVTHVVFDAIYAYVSVLKDAFHHFTAEAVAVLTTIAKYRRSSSSSSTITMLNKDFFLSLCLSPSMSVQSWLLSNAEIFHIHSSLLVTLLLWLTKDPYPYMRRAALGCLAGLNNLVDIKESGLIEGCYGRAVELLFDTNEYVRSVAIHVVSDWGQMLAVSNHEVGNEGWFDAVFVQLCSMVRDMCVEVRIEAFLALGKIKLVSEDILLQTLSKKILRVVKERKNFCPHTAGVIDLPTSNVAGVFVHGLEDEFFEVRRSACNSLGRLTIFSIQFANDALNLLIDMLNDDSMTVRLQSLETIHYIATCDRLKMQEAHMHMFLGTLVDSSTLIRCAARNILRLVKLPVMEMFKSSISGLLTNLETYPEDEADIFFVIFNIGRSHGNFAINYVREVSQEEIKLSCEGELRMDNARVPAILVLAIAATLSHKHRVCNIMARIFSYAIPFLGRISLSLRDFMDRDALLAYLSRYSRFMHFSATELFREDDLFISVVGGIQNQYNEEIIQIAPLQQIVNETSVIQPHKNLWDPRHVTSVEEYQQKAIIMHEETTNAVKLILRTVAETWPMIKSGCKDEVQRALRNCKEELATITMDSPGSVCLLAFASQYIQVIQVLAKVWEHFLPSRKFHGNATQKLDLLLEKIQTYLRRMRSSFSGLSKEEELHVLDLALLAFVMRLSMVETCCHLSTLKRLRATMSRVELLCEEGSIKHSNFARELKKLFSLWESSDEVLYYSLPLQSLLKFFSLKDVMFYGKFKHIRAELDVPGNDSENPLPFISGFPVGVTFQITLYNVSREDKLWLKMAVEDHIQYVFLDFNQIEVYNEVRKVTLSVPFYRTPKTDSFSLRACIGKEYPFEDAVYLGQGRGGPKCQLTFLCEEKEVYLVLRS